MTGVADLTDQLWWHLRWRHHIPITFLFDDDLRAADDLTAMHRALHNPALNDPSHPYSDQFAPTHPVRASPDYAYTYGDRDA